MVSRYLKYAFPPTNIFSKVFPESISSPSFLPLGSLPFLREFQTCEKTHARGSDRLHELRKRRALRAKNSQSFEDPQNNEKSLTIPQTEEFQQKYALASQKIQSAELTTKSTVINSLSLAASVLEHPALIVSREIEMMNLFLGFEQANKYSLQTPTGQIVGYMAEEDSMGKAVLRNVLHTHRSFTSTIFDVSGNIVLRVKRPVYLLNSTITIENAEGEIIGEVFQSWHLWRRRYDLFRNKEQFGAIDSGFLAYEFDIVDDEKRLLAKIDKNFTGFAREIFTDANQYIIKMDILDNSERPLLYDERAITLAAAISIDFDYFSRHSGRGGIFPSLPLFGIFGGSHSTPPAEIDSPSMDPSAGLPITPPPSSSSSSPASMEGANSDFGSPAADQGGFQWGAPSSSPGEKAAGTNEYGDSVWDDEPSGEESSTGEVIKNIFGQIFGNDE